MISSINTQVSNRKKILKELVLINENLNILILSDNISKKLTKYLETKVSFDSGSNIYDVIILYNYDLENFDPNKYSCDNFIILNDKYYSIKYLSNLFNKSYDNIFSYSTIRTITNLPTQNRPFKYLMRKKYKSRLDTDNFIETTKDSIIKIISREIKLNKILSKLDSDNKK